MNEFKFARVLIFYNQEDISIFKGIAYLRSVERGSNLFQFDDGARASLTPEDLNGLLESLEKQFPIRIDTSNIFSMPDYENFSFYVLLGKEIDDNFLGGIWDFDIKCEKLFKKGWKVKNEDLIRIFKPNDGKLKLQELFNDYRAGVMMLLKMQDQYLKASDVFKINRHDDKLSFENSRDLDKMRNLDIDFLNFFILDGGKSYMEAYDYFVCYISIEEILNVYISYDAFINDFEKKCTSNNLFEYKKLKGYLENAEKYDFRFCLDDFCTLQETTENSLKRNTAKVIDTLPPISTVVDKIRRNVIGHDEAIKGIVLAVYSNLDLARKNLTSSEVITLKNNILMSGPSGIGKTEIGRQLADKLSIPVLIEDINQYSGTGWHGSDMKDIIKKMYHISGENAMVAERGILFLDEIDKIAVGGRHSDHNTLEVQQNLLKIIEGGIYEFKTNCCDSVPFDTSYLTVICAGAFIDYQGRHDVSSKNGMRKEDYIKYGLMPEFVRRMKTFITLSDLSKEDKIR